MRIAFDAKRAFHNSSGLGNYSRYTISAVCDQFPDHDYQLYTPSVSTRIGFQPPASARIAYPNTLGCKIFKSYWRSVRLTKRLQNDKIDLYHGLSSELPPGISSSGIKSVVTVHDLIYMRLPELYKAIDRKVYLKKTRNALQEADQIIAISQQTKQDLIELLDADERKINVIYQGCHPWFYNTVEDELRLQIRKKYNLPKEYLLYVGTVEKRKNLLKIIQALHLGKIDLPLVAVGRSTAYMDEIHAYLRNNKVSNVSIIHFVPNQDLPAVYQMAQAFVYPSAYEGFGIPVLEALNSGIPVVTSRGGCLEETMGQGGLLVDPENEEEMITVIRKITEDNKLRTKLISAGKEHTLKFRPEKTIPQLFEVYNKCFV